MATRKAAAAPAAPTKPGKAVVKADQNNALAVPEEMASLYAQDAGAGLERATVQDYALPFIYLLQKGSPQVDEDSEKYIEGAKAGMFLNTVTGQIFPELEVIPVDFEKVYIEWIPRDAGGGFVAQYKSKSEAEQNKQEETQIVDTANHYVLVKVDEDKWQPAIISMTSTKLKASRNWLSRISQVMVPGPSGSRQVAPSFARIYKIQKQGPVQNEKGTFFILQVVPVEGPEGWVKDPELYQQAKDFFAQLRAGIRGADYNKAAETVVEAEVDETAPKF